MPPSQAPMPMAQQPIMQPQMPYMQPQMQPQMPYMQQNFAPPSPPTAQPQVQQNAGRELYSPDILKIIERGYLIVAMHNVDLPPFFMKGGNNQTDGVDADIARRLAKELGVDIRIIRSSNSFDEVVDTVARGEADIGISKLSYTFERSKKVLYTDPYIRLFKSLLINRPLMARFKAERSIKTIGDLLNNKSTKIGVVAGSSYAYFARSLFPKATIAPFPNWDEVIKAVSTGAVLAAFRDDLEIKKTLSLKDEIKANVSPMVLKTQPDPIQMVVGPENHFLKEMINSFLSSERFDFTADVLLRRFTDYLKPPPAAPQQDTRGY